MRDDTLNYLAYLVRLWRAGGEESAWRASVESPYTGERHVFADLDALFTFLEEKTRGVGAATGPLSESDAHR